jgi:hypothetical protein
MPRNPAAYQLALGLEDLEGDLARVQGERQSAGALLGRLSSSGDIEEPQRLVEKGVPFLLMPGGAKTLPITETFVENWLDHAYESDEGLGDRRSSRVAHGRFPGGTAEMICCACAGASNDATITNIIGLSGSHPCTRLAAAPARIKLKSSLS